MNLSQSLTVKGICAFTFSALAFSPLAQAQRPATFDERLSADDTALNESFGASLDAGPLGRTTFGSYGELHYRTGDPRDELDTHRLVLFIGHEFNDKVRFVTEFEIEHLIRNKPGKNEVEFELEQAYFEFDLPSQYALQVGGFLVPVGIINEIHEPTTFYGVERNRIESEIIPSTWTEFGVLLRKNYDSGLQWDLAVHRGLKLDSNAFNNNGPDIRSGRQSAGSFDNLFSALTARVKYTGINGLELGVAAQYQDDISEASTDNSAILTSGHFIYQNGGFGLRGLVANWSIDGETPNGEDDIDNQFGGYIEPSYKWDFDNGMAVGVFARALYYENEDRPEGQNEYSVGVNFWPTENFVVKAELAREDRVVSSSGAALEDQEVLYLGLGYSF